MATEISLMEEPEIGPNGYPAKRIKAMRIYAPSHDRFFDALVEFLAAYAGVFYGLIAQQLGSATAFGPRQTAVLLSTKATGVALTFFPYFIFEPLINNRWPDEVQLAEFPLVDVPLPSGPGLDSAARIHAGILEGSFVRYFESNRSAVEAKYGSDPYGWPPEWNFARVVRNAFAHGGKIKFDNVRAGPVAWRHLTYSPADNGKTITFTDMSPVELILLLEDIDGLL